MAIGAGLQVVAHAAAEVGERVAGEGWRAPGRRACAASRERRRRRRRTSARPPQAAPRRADRRRRRGRRGCGNEVEPVDVVAHVAGQQPAGEREGPRHAVGGRARRREATSRHAAAAARASSRPADVGGDESGGDLGAEQDARDARARDACRRRRGRGPRPRRGCAAGTSGLVQGRLGGERVAVDAPSAARSPAESCGARPRSTRPAPSSPNVASRSAISASRSPSASRPSRPRRAGSGPAAARTAVATGGAIAGSVRAGAWT